MSTLTLNLPDQLLRTLQLQAQKAGVSLEELIIFTLTRQSASGYEVTALAEDAVREQQLRRAALRQSLGHVTKDEAKQLLQTRAVVAPEADLDVDAAALLRAHWRNTSS